RALRLLCALCVRFSKGPGSPLSRRCRFRGSIWAGTSPGDTLMSIREPLLHPVPVKDLRPTQITVGLHEVKAKRPECRKRVTNIHGDGVKNDGDVRGSDFLGRHMIPVVLGPKQRPYVLDHHHLARALLDEGVEHVLVTVLKRLDTLSKASFWVYLDNHAW